MEPDFERYFVEIARIEEDKLQIKPEALSSTFSSTDLSNCNTAIHVIICHDVNCDTSLLTGHLMNDLISYEPELNAHLDTTKFSVLQLFEKSRSSEKQMVCSTSPIFTWSHDGKKKTANFFIDVCNKNLPDYTILSALAAFGASSIIVASEMDLTPDLLLWVKNVYLTTCKIKNNRSTPFRFPNLYYVFNSNNSSLGLKAGEQRPDFIHDIYQGIPDHCNLLNLMAINTRAFCLKEITGIFTEIPCKKLSKFNCDLSYLNLNKLDDPSTEDAPGLLGDTLDFEELKDFADTEWLDIVLDAFKKPAELFSREPVPISDEDEEMLSNDGSQRDPNSDTEMDTHPWNATIANKAESPRSFEDIIPSRLIEQYAPQPPPSQMTNLCGEVKNAGPKNKVELLNRANPNSSVLIESHLINSSIYKPLSAENTSFKRACLSEHEDSFANSNIEQFIGNHKNFEEGANILTNAALQAKMGKPHGLEHLVSHSAAELYDNYRIAFNKAVIQTFADSKLCQNVTAQSIFDTASCQVDCRIDTAKEEEIQATIKTQLVEAVESIRMYQSHIESVIQKDVYIETDQEFLHASREILHKMKVSFPEPFKKAFQGKLEIMERQYFKFNSQLRETESQCLSLYVDSVIQIFKKVLKTPASKANDFVPNFASGITKPLQMLYGNPLPQRVQMINAEINRKLQQMFGERVSSEQSVGFPAQLEVMKKNIKESSTFESTHCISTTPISQSSSTPVFLPKQNVLPKPTVQESRPLQLLINHKIIPYPESAGSRTRSGAEYSNHQAAKISTNNSSELSKLGTKTQVVIMFKWNEITAYSLDGPKPIKIFGPVPNKINVEGTEIIFGETCDRNFPSMAQALDCQLFCFKNYLVKDKQILEKIALIFLKMNNILCSKLQKNELTLLTIFPAFCCFYLADVVNNLSAITGLDIINYETSGVILMDEIQRSRSQYDTILVICDHSHHQSNPCTIVTNYRRNQGSEYFVQNIHVKFDTWKYNGYSYRNALAKLDIFDKKSLKVLIYAAPTRYLNIQQYVSNEYYESIIQKWEFKTIDVCSTLCSLRNAALNGNNEIENLLTESSILCSVEKMHKSCKHSELKFQSSQIAGLRQKVCAMASADFKNLVHLKNKIRTGLAEKLNQAQEDGKDKIITAMKINAEETSLRALKELAVQYRLT